MKKITTTALMAILCIQLSFSQETYKRIQINNPSHNVIHDLQELGIDLTCGVVINQEALTIELFDYELEQLSNKGITYDILIEDMQTFYSERSIKDGPKALAELEHEKMLSSQQRSYSVNEIINNVGQHNECNEIDWATPQNWNLNPNLASGSNTFGGCLTYDMVLQELDDMRALYPNLISAKLDASVTFSDTDVETTIEGRTMYYVRISDNPDMDEDGEPETLYQSLIHSREAASVMQLLYYMWYILENYENDAAIRNLVNNQALYFIPVFNPDGFVYNEVQAPNGGGGQRKNRNTSGGCSIYADGIDLNRNSGYFWDNGGSSDSTCSGTYMGSAPFSEIETQIMRDFFDDHDFELALNHHSFKNAMLHAYAGVDRIPGTSTPFPNSHADEYSKYNHDMTEYNRYAYGPSTYISSLNSGNMNDWMLGGANYNYTGFNSGLARTSGTGSGKETMAWTPENGLSSEGTGGTYGGFWPQPSNFLPISKRAMRMNFLAAYFSGKYGKLHDLNQSDITTTSGNLTFAIENLGQKASDFTVTVTPVLGVNTVGPAVTESFSAAQVLEQRTITIPYTLDSGIQPNDIIKFQVVFTNDYASDNVLLETYITKPYNPNVVFTATADPTNLNGWTSSGSWTTTTDGYQGTNAYKSNSTTVYGTNEDETLQLNGTRDFTNMETVLIQYHAKWDLERSFDFVTIEGSTDGSTWTELCGKLTKVGAQTANNSYSGTPSGIDTTSKNSASTQNGVIALYDGDTQDKWNMEEIVIDASTNAFLFNESTVHLRFRLDTDDTNRQDSYENADFEGFTFDNFKIIEIQASCDNSTPPTGLSVTAITPTSATADWNAVLNTNYDLRYREIGAGSWTDVLDLTINTYDLTGLNPATDYEVQVATKCGAIASSYSISYYFSTENPCTTTIDTFTDTIATSYSESFESDFGGWEQDDTDDFDWTRKQEEPGGDNDSTPSNNTGPELASDGEYFLYIEASDPNFPSKTARLTSPCFDLSLYENAMFSFDYHMFGANIGELTIDVSTDFGGSYTTLNSYTLTGQQNTSHADPWKTQIVDLSGTYDGQIIKLRFSATTDSDGTNGWQGDISIDNFSIIADVSTLNNPSFESTDVKIYPNPFNEQLTIQLSNNMVNDSLNVSVYDISGRVIMTITDLTLKDNQIELTNFDSLASGSYFIKLTNKTRNNVLVKRVIKN